MTAAVAETAWQTNAACAEHPTSVFYPTGPSGEDLSNDLDATADARRICARCPAQIACLDYAVTNHIGYGVWGGRTPASRRALHRWRGTQTTTAEPATAAERQRRYQARELEAS